MCVALFRFIFVPCLCACWVCALSMCRKIMPKPVSIINTFTNRKTKSSKSNWSTEYLYVLLIQYNSDWKCRKKRKTEDLSYPCLRWHRHAHTRSVTIWQIQNKCANSCMASNRTRQGHPCSILLELFIYTCVNMNLNTSPLLCTYLLDGDTMKMVV